MSNIMRPHRRRDPRVLVVLAMIGLFLLCVAALGGSIMRADIRMTRLARPDLCSPPVKTSAATRASGTSVDPARKIPGSR